MFHLNIGMRNFKVLPEITSVFILFQIFEFNLKKQGFCELSWLLYKTVFVPFQT